MNEKRLEIQRLLDLKKQKTQKLYKGLCVIILSLKMFTQGLMEESAKFTIKASTIESDGVS